MGVVGLDHAHGHVEHHVQPVVTLLRQLAVEPSAHPHHEQEQVGQRRAAREVDLGRDLHCAPPGSPAGNTL
jgi:hypothetical protein